MFVIIVGGGKTGSSVAELLLKEKHRVIVAEWLESLLGQPRIRWINRDNLGAGPGRNAGLDLWAGKTPYTLMLDGGILPPRGGVKVLKEYLSRHPEVSVISPEVATCYTEHGTQATLYFPDFIPDNVCFPQCSLSGTAYALVRAEAWEKARFCEDGPFALPGWGVDDNEMQMRWNAAGVLHHDIGELLNIKLLRRRSGSFQRLFKETGIWPNQFGSVYEQRVVKMFQDWRFQFDPLWHKYGQMGMLRRQVSAISPRRDVLRFSALQLYETSWWDRLPACAPHRQDAGATKNSPRQEQQCSA